MAKRQVAEEKTSNDEASLDHPLITKYRPRSSAEIVGQDAIVKSLDEVIKKKLTHAFLFTGPAGCGKTTLARLTALQLGCQPADIQEIDGATYSGIDDMRSITATLMYRPMSKSGLRMLVIDECHALSKPAWQAVLKAVEEPPKWAYWALCTTELGKVPETIKTRSTHYEVKPVAFKVLQDFLDKVADKEEFKCSGGVIDLCCKMANGSPRQALANLAKCHDLTEREEAASLLRTFEDSEEIIALAQALLKGNWEACKRIMADLKVANVSAEGVRQVVRGYMTSVILSAKEERQATAALAILEHFSQPFYNTGDGISPVVLAVGKALFGR